MKIYAIYLECKCVGNDNIIKGYFTAEAHIENDPDLLFQELERVSKFPNVLRGKVVRVPSEFIRRFA